MKTSRLALIAAFGCLVAPVAVSGQYVYPAKGQDKATQAKDEAECSTWATQQTGFDPAKAPATATAKTGAPVDASAVVSALGAMPGGMGGGGSGMAASAIGAIPGVGGTGALGGAAPLGGVAGSVATVSQVVGKAQPQPQGQAQASTRANFDRARAACLNGRGYSVQ